MQEVTLLLVQACRPFEQDEPVEQLPFWHFCPDEHALLQLPQWFASPLVSTHWPLQFVKPGRHTHEPPLQVSSELHPVLQSPQCRGSFCRSMQRLPPQVMVPGPHPHWPVTQAWVSEHWCPQEPQSVVLVAVLTSQPLLAVPSQSVKPELHLNPHFEEVQVREALARVEQELLQLPQWLGLLLVLTHCPPQLV